MYFSADVIQLDWCKTQSRAEEFRGRRQQQNVTVLNEKKQVESAREKLEQANKRLLSKLANASERIQKLEKKNRILKWREEKESVQQTPENNKHINSKSLNNSTRDKLRMEKPKLKTGNDAGET